MDWKAYKMGENAFHAGQSAIPFRDCEFARYLENAEWKTSVMSALDSWHTGFTEANLAQDVPEWTAEENANFQALRQG